MTTRKLSSEQWSQYWKKGTLTTFLGRFENNYDGPILDFWHEQLGELAPGSSVIDLATGNGALALIAAEFSQENNAAFAITAIDYADIDPNNLVLTHRDPKIVGAIDFLSQVSMEDTGLEDNTFDCAISQFGFEYGDPERSVQEVSRILKSSARLGLMLHREGSVLYDQAKTGAEQVSVSLKSSLHDSLKELLRLLDKLRLRGKDPAKNEKAERLREEINELTNDLHEAMGGYTDPAQLGFFLENSMAIFRPEFSSKTLVEKCAMLDEIREESAAYQLRMQDLMSSVLSAEQIDGLEQLLQKQGFVVKRSEMVRFEGHVFCHAMTATR
jgi:ubiquinone/menaquinone biosynthesis C-methylase UbiE